MSGMTAARIGVVGTGWWATEAHIPGLIEHPRAEVPALCDLDVERASRAAEHYGVAAVYDDLDRMLARESLDGLVVASSNATHFELARRAIDAGLHVLIEKPMTETRARGPGAVGGGRARRHGDRRRPHVSLHAAGAAAPAS